jgi:hypothetical protein
MAEIIQKCRFTIPLASFCHFAFTKSKDDAKSQKELSVCPTKPPPTAHITRRNYGHAFSHSIESKLSRYGPYRWSWQLTKQKKNCQAMARTAAGKSCQRLLPSYIQHRPTLVLPGA